MSPKKSPKKAAAAGPKAAPAKAAAKKSAAAGSKAAPAKAAKKVAAAKPKAGARAAASRKKAAPARPVAKPAKAAAPKAAKKVAAVRTAAKKAAGGPKAAPARAALKIGGAKAGRIAQIVAESMRQKSAPAPAPVAAPAPDDDALRVAKRAATELFAKKAEDVVLMDLRNLSTVADYYLIATCRNEPQMRAILGGMQRALSREGIRALGSEYVPGVRWAVVDYGDVIVHLFEKQTRGFYSLERLWADAPSTTLRAEDYVKDADGEEAGSADGANPHDDL